MRNEIKLVLSDIDDTLLSDNHIVEEETTKAIKQLKNNNIKFGLATGRNPHAVIPLLNSWGIEDHIDFIVGLNGAHVMDFNSDIDIILDKLDPTDIYDIVNKYKDTKAATTLNEDDMLYTNKIDDIVEIYCKVDSLKPKLVDVEEFNNFKDVVKLILTGSKEILNQIESQEQKNVSKNYNTIRTHDNMLEFQAKGISKAKGIKKLLENQDFTENNICVFGDGLNDIEMFELCKYSVAMGNAKNELKEISTHITDTNDNNGVSKFISKYLI